MWKFVYICSCVTLLAFYSCRQDSLSTLPALEKAEALMEEHPDSSLAILQNVNSPENLSDGQYATWCLLLTEAKDKTFGIHTSDSLISVAANYFEKQKDIERKAKVWYYMGRVNQDLQQYEETLGYYQKAISYAKKLQLNKQLMLIFNQMSNLYCLQKVYDEALIAAKKAEGYNSLAGDTFNMPYIIRDIGRVYLCMGEMDSSQVYYDRSLSVAKSFNLKAEAAIQREIGINYKMQGYYELAIQSIRNSIAIYPEGVSASTYLNMGSSFYFLNHYDSAQYYLSKSQNSQDIFTKAGSFLYLYKLAVSEKDYEKAIEYNAQYQILSDSINANNQEGEIRELIHKYEQQELKTDLELQVFRERTIYGGCVFLLLISLLGSLVFYLKQRLVKERIVRLQEKRIQQERSLRLQSEEQLLQNKYQIELNLRQIDIDNQQIKQKEESLRCKTDELSTINQHLLTYKNRLLEKENEIIELKMYNKRYSDRLFSESGFLERIQIAGADVQSLEQPVLPLMNHEFHLLKKELNLCYDDFVIRLESKFPQLKEQEINICCLLKAGGRTMNIAYIVGLTRNAVTKKKGYILKKMDLIDEKDIDSLDGFLCYF